MISIGRGEIIKTFVTDFRANPCHKILHVGVVDSQTISPLFF
jgi:hypothetical protein